LGVEEWRTPVGRAETTRKGEGEGECVWLAMVMTAMQEKAKEGRRDGRGGTRAGTTRKNREGTSIGHGRSTRE
jgi:hypothetical protein